MKKLIGLFALLACGVQLLAVSIAEVALTNGAVLHNVSIVRWQRDTVVLKHLGGIDSVRLNSVTPASLKSLEAARDAEPKPKSNQPMVITGEVFVSSQGGNNYKLGATLVRIYRAFDLQLLTEYSKQVAYIMEYRRSALDPETKNEMLARQAKVDEEWEKLKNKLPSPDYSTTTDSEGKFKITLTGVPKFSLVVISERLLRSGRLERYIWIKNSWEMDEGPVILSNQNLLDN